MEPQLPPDVTLNFLRALKRRLEDVLASGFTSVELTTQRPASERAAQHSNRYPITDHDQKELEEEIARLDIRILKLTSN